MDLEDNISEDSFNFSENSDYEGIKEVYQKYEFYSSDGVFLGFAGKGQVRWISKKRACCIVDHINKKIILDKPYDPAKIKATRHIDKENKCVCCGDEYGLNTTRIIPQYITTLFPLEHKTGSENIISICEMCQKKKNDFQGKYLDATYAKYNVDVKNLKKYDFLQKCYKLSKRYLNSFIVNDRTVRRDKFIRKIAKFLNEHYFQTKKIVVRGDVQNFTKEDVENFVRDVEENNIIDLNRDYIHEELLLKIGDVKIFKELWMADFFDCMQVSHMPEIIQIK
jgi:hypothetical protein